MASATKTSMEDYLRLQTKPECELVDGELRQKPLGTKEHMQVEKRLLKLLERYEEQALGEALSEISLRRGPLRRGMFSAPDGLRPRLMHCLGIDSDCGGHRLQGALVLTFCVRTLCHRAGLEILFH